MLFNRCAFGSLLALGILSLLPQDFHVQAQPKKDNPKENSGAPTLVDPSGKEVVLKKWKIVYGLHKLSWLDGKPEAFEMREFGSTTFKEGVITWIPFKRVEAIRYDYDKETVFVDVAGLEKPLEGTTKFKDINMITIEAEVDQGASGVADLRYKGGIFKGGFKSVKFPDVKPFEKQPEKGDLFSFVVVPEGKGTNPTLQTVTNVKPLYRFADGSEKLVPHLIFKKTLKVDFANIKSIHVGEHNAKEKTAECEVTLKDGMQISVTLLGQIQVEGKNATFVGFLGECPAGYKLFPIHAIQEFQPGEIKLDLPKIEPPKKKVPKKDDPKKDEPKKEQPKEA